MEERVDAPVLQAVRQGNEVDVLVEYEASIVDREIGKLANPQIELGRDLIEAKRALYQSLSQEFVSSLTDSLTIIRTYDHFPMVLVRVPSYEALSNLAVNQKTVRVYENKLLKKHLTQSLSVTRQSAASAGGYTGSGQTVAVLDTGADYTLSTFGTCSHPFVQNQAACRIKRNIEVPPLNGRATDNDPRDLNDGHGTNVAAIVRGVAPQSDLLVYDVFSFDSGLGAEVAVTADVLTAINDVISLDTAGTYNIASMNISAGSTTYTAACTSSAFQTALTNARTAGIIASISSGNDGETDAIAEPACVSGVVRVGASYDSNLGSINNGVCTDNTTGTNVSVCSSNTSSQLSLYAPGYFISAGGQGFGGSSQAAAHVAGAIAVVRAARPTESVDDIISRISDASALSLVDHGNFQRNVLDIEAAAQDSISRVVISDVQFDDAGDSGTVTMTCVGVCSWTVSSASSWITFTAPVTGTGNGSVAFTIAANPMPGVPRQGEINVGRRQLLVQQGTDGIGPTGTISVNQAPGPVQSRSVTLAISATDPSGVDTMCISNATTCTTFIPYATTANWTLSVGSGSKVVRIWFRDTLGNQGGPYAASAIILDQTAPTVGQLNYTRADGSITLTWTGQSDTLSGLATTNRYRLVYQSGSTAPASCVSGTELYRGNNTTYTHTVPNGLPAQNYRLCTTDGVGNENLGVTRTGLFAAPEFVAPTGGGITINVTAPALSVTNAGLQYINTRNVTVQYDGTGTDASGVTGLCLSNTSACSQWFTPGAISWQLTASDGIKTVRGWLRDSWGNVSTTSFAVTVRVDTAGPLNGTASASNGNGSITVSWSGFTDLSGVASYKVFVNAGSAPTNACTDTVPMGGYTGAATSNTFTGLMNGTRYYFLVCAVDRLGATSATGRAANAFATADLTPPDTSNTTCRINGGATYTRTTAVMVESLNMDVSTAEVCASTSGTTCTSWSTDLVNPRPLTLAAGNGTKTAYVYFGDSFSNRTTTPITCTIVMDTTAPTAPTNVVLTANTNETMTLTWTAGTDTGPSGLAGTRVLRKTSAISSCTDATATITNGATSPLTVTLTGGNGTLYYYRVCMYDNASNYSTGVNRSARLAPEYNAPVNPDIVIVPTAPGPGELTTSRTVNLNITYPTDASTLHATGMCVSNANTCSAWRAPATSMSWLLTSVDGTKTVCVWFRDQWQNTMTTPDCDTVTLDVP